MTGRDDVGADAFDDGFNGKAANPEDADSFAEVIDLLREGPLELTDEQPTAGLWDAIAGELGLSGSSVDSVESTESSDDVRSGGLFDVEPGAGNVVSMADRRPRWGRPAALLTLAAAVVLLLAVPVGLALRSGESADLVATAQLELLDGQTGQSVPATLLSVDGDLVLEVDAPTTVPAGEFLELWLLEVGDDGVEGLESLGRVDGSGRYDVPDDMDLERFSVVDISVELDDGNPDHSGISVVRGELA